MIVGYNAVSSIAQDFWKYWNDRYGFNFELWEHDYIASKLKKSPTRLRLDRLRTALNQPILETNLFAHPSPSQRALEGESKSTDVLDFLLDATKPSVIIAHGRHASEYIARRLLLGPSLPVNLRKALSNGRVIGIKGVPHLSRGWSYLKIDELACEINKFSISLREK
ncbi:MAG: hypothetical protein G3I10_10790 [Ferrovum sp.]|nr:hypothetical protein [Ferrovum sp.]